MKISEQVEYAFAYVKQHGGEVVFNHPPYMTLVAKLDESVDGSYEGLILEYIDDSGQVDYALMIALNRNTKGFRTGQQLWTGQRVPISPSEFVESFQDIFHLHFWQTMDNTT